MDKYKVKVELGSADKEVRSLDLFDQQFAFQSNMNNQLKKSNNGSIEIDMFDWEPGKYFIRMDVGEEQRIVKLVRRADLELRNRN